ncbi:MAG: cytochrome c oxidase assembly factor 1 family protein [Pirellulales bacterium]|nr:cytochrome c oxidase assembly factor 1 family protein [Pirellulales bacterium]
MSFSDQPTPVPPLSSPAKRSWWQRNRFWFLPLLILSPVLLCCVPCGGVFYFMQSMAKNSKAHGLVLEAIRGDARVIEALGEPIDESFVFGGGDPNLGPFNLFSWISGPKNKGTVEALVVREGDQWVIARLIVRPSEGDPIDLVADPNAEPALPIDEAPADAMPAEDAAPADESAPVDETPAEDAPPADEPAAAEEPVAESPQ